MKRALFSVALLVVCNSAVVAQTEVKAEIKTGKAALQLPPEKANPPNRILKRN